MITNADLVLSKSSFERLNKYADHPGQSVALIGNRWLKKSEAARELAAQLLDIEIEKLDSYPYFTEVSSIDNKKIGIEEIRKAGSLLNLKVPSKKMTSRLILVNDAELMTQEAQNALLKDLEEPPEGTIFILTTTSLNSLLPTITSRMQHILLSTPPESELARIYASKGFDDIAIKNAFNMSGGQPGLMDLLLEEDDHPLNRATKLAKELLSGSKFDQLALVNDLAKDKTELGYFFFILKEMAKIGIKSANQASARRWQKILSSCIKSESMLSSNTQVKLTLMDFILSIS